MYNTIWRTEQNNTSFNRVLKPILTYFIKNDYHIIFLFNSNRCIFNKNSASKGQAQSIFRAVNIMSMTLWWWICVIIHLSKPIVCVTPRVNLNVHYGLWVIMMYHCRFIDCNKCITLLGMLIAGQAMYVQGVYGKHTFCSIFLWT